MFFPVFEIIKILKQFVYFKSSRHYMLVAMYIVISYFQEHLDAVPYLHFVAPPNTGKSTLLKMTELLAYNPLHVVRITDPALYRALDKRRGMLILDEAEIKGAMLKIFLNGYKKGGSIAVCDKKDPRDFISFQVYGTKITAGMKEISDPALKTRYITIQMTKPDKSNRPHRFLLAAHSAALKKIANNLLRLREDKVIKKRFIDSYLNLGEVEGITDRNYELFAPFFALAKNVDEEARKDVLFNKVYRFATNYIEERKEEDFFTNWPTSVIFSVWKYAGPLLEIQYYKDNPYFWAEGLCKHIKKDLSLSFIFSVKSLGKLLDNYGLLLSPEKRKVRRIKNAEIDFYTKKETAMHYHLDKARLEKFASDLVSYNTPPKEDPDDTLQSNMPDESTEIMISKMVEKSLSHGFDPTVKNRRYHRSRKFRR